MSKKMKKTALVTSPSPAYAGAYEDHNYNKINSKHQALLQDYQELLKDTDDIQNKLAIAKQRKKILLAEVRFLRKKHECLSKTRSLNHPQEQHIAIEYQPKLNRKESTLSKRDASQFKLPPLPDLKHKGRVYAGKEGGMKNMASLPPLDLNRKVASRSRKEADSSYRKRIISVETNVMNTNQIEKKYQGGNGNGGFSSTTPTTNTTTTRMPTFDLNQDTNFSGKETSSSTHGGLIFDLNKVSMEEEELQNSYEPITKFEEQPTKRGGGGGGLLKAGNEDQSTDNMKLSLCRNAGGEGPSRMGKRKISWQDSVALRV